MVRRIWNDNVSMGDCICSMPGTLQLARWWQADGYGVAIYWTNASVAELFPHEKYEIARLREPAESYDKVLSMHDVVHRRVTIAPSEHWHPTAIGMAEAGFPELSTGPIRPEIVQAEFDIKTYDVIISPYVLAEIQRFWPLDRWQVVIDAIKASHPGVSIGVLCGTKMPIRDDLRKIDPRDQTHFSQDALIQSRSRLTGVDLIVDRPLLEVAYLLKKAKLVLTVDTGPARLAHAVGCNHVLLANNHVPYEWATYPEAEGWYGPLSLLEPAEVVKLAEGAWPRVTAA